MQKKHVMAKDNWSDFEVGFIVGLIEGEGTISLNKRIRKRYGKGFTLGPIIHISNTQPSLLEAAQKIIGGGISKHEQSLHARGEKPMYNVFIHNRENIAKVLKKITPHLITKKRRAELLLEYCESRLAKSPIMGAGTRTPYSDREIEICNEVKVMNLR